MERYEFVSREFLGSVKDRLVDVDEAMVSRSVHPVSGLERLKTKRSGAEPDTLVSFDCSGLRMELKPAAISHGVEPVVSGRLPTQFNPIDAGLINILVAFKASIQNGTFDENSIVVSDTSEDLFREFDELGVFDPSKPLASVGFPVIPSRYTRPDPAKRFPQVVIRQPYSAPYSVCGMLKYIMSMLYQVSTVTAHGGNVVIYLPMIPPVLHDQRYKATFQALMALACDMFVGGYTFYSSRSTPLASPEICLVLRSLDLSRDFEPQFSLLAQCLTEDTVPLIAITYDTVLDDQLKDYYQVIFNRSGLIGKKFFDMARLYNSLMDDVHCEHCSYSIIAQPAGDSEMTPVDVASTNLRCAINMHVRRYLQTHRKSVVYFVGQGVTISGLENFKGLTGLQIRFYEIDPYKVEALAKKLKGRAEFGDYTISTKNLNCKRTAQMEFARHPPDIVVCNFSANYLAPFLDYCKTVHPTVPLVGVAFTGKSDFEQYMDGKLLIKSEFNHDYYKQLIPSYSSAPFNEPVIDLTGYVKLSPVHLLKPKRVEVSRVLDKYTVIWHERMVPWNLKQIPTVPATFFRVSAPKFVDNYDKFMQARGFTRLKTGIGVFCPFGYDVAYAHPTIRRHELYLNAQQRSVVSHFPFMYMQFVMDSLQHMLVVRTLEIPKPSGYIDRRTRMIRGERERDEKRWQPG